MLPKTLRLQAFSDLVKHHLRRSAPQNDLHFTFRQRPLYRSLIALQGYAQYSLFIWRIITRLCTQCVAQILPISLQMQLTSEPYDRCINANCQGSQGISAHFSTTSSPTFEGWLTVDKMDYFTLSLQTQKATSGWHSRAWPVDSRGIVDTIPSVIACLSWGYEAF